MGADGTGLDWKRRYRAQAAERRIIRATIPRRKAEMGLWMKVPMSPLEMRSACSYQESY